MLYSSGGDAVFPYSVASSSSWYKAAATNRVATLNQVPCVYIGTPNHQWPFTFFGQRWGSGDQDRRLERTHVTQSKWSVLWLYL